MTYVTIAHGGEARSQGTRACVRPFAGNLSQPPDKRLNGIKRKGVKTAKKSLNKALFWRIVRQALEEALDAHGIGRAKSGLTLQQEFLKGEYLQLTLDSTPRNANMKV